MSQADFDAEDTFGEPFGGVFDEDGEVSWVSCGFLKESDDVNGVLGSSKWGKLNLPGLGVDFDIP